MKAVLLHLSDIHVRSAGSVITSRAARIAATLCEVLPEADALFLVITGDIAHSGTKEEYAEAAKFLDTLLGSIGDQFARPVHVVMVPGNHDGMFKDSGNSRKASIEKVVENGESFVDDDIIEQCTKPQQHYFEFEARYASAGLESGDRLWKEYRFAIGDYAISFSAINASWMSRVPEEQGGLVFPVKRYIDTARNEASVRIALLHHPLNWYAQATYHPFRSLCEEQFQIVMTGHEHVGRMSVTSDANSNQTVSLEAGALVGDDQKSSCFSVVKLDLTKQRFAQEKFYWDGNQYLPENGAAVWDSYVPLPSGKRSGFRIVQEMQASLESLGAKFSHPNSESLRLSDVFVYPELQELSPEEDTPDTVSADVIPKQIDKCPKVLVMGDDQYGKSSLLSHMYQVFHGAGQIPVLFEGQDLAGLNEDQFARVVLRQIEKQYGPDAIVKYGQTARDKKIALVDNLDKLAVRVDTLVRAIGYLNTHFSAVVATAGDRFDVAVLSSHEASTALADYSSFRMLGFGYKLRNELIRRWYQVGREIEFAELQEKVHSAEHLINSVLGKGLVPMTAFNVLILLQTIEVNERGVLANAGLAEYYEFLIRRNLMDAKVRHDEFGEFLSYLSHLAWEMHTQKTKVISEHDFLEFNRRFSSDIHSTSFVSRIRTLVDSKVLVEKDGGYSFGYSYLRYFFVARYLAEHLEDDPSLKNVIVRACHHLYIKENANIVLFLTHHTHSKWIAQEVASVLNQLLSDIKPLRIEDDTQVLNSWVSEKARLAIDASDVVQNQQQVREADDKATQIQEIEHTAELQSVRELDQLTQLNLLFKTSEILGQILKGRYGSYRKEDKEALLRGLFEAPLRGVNFFLSLVNQAPEALLNEISSRIQNKFPNVPADKVDRVAKRFIFSVIGAVADSFLSRQGEIVGSPKLSEQIFSLSKTEGGLAYGLLAVSAQLSFPNHVPLREIKELSERLDRNYFGYKILQGLVARHLYMFSLGASERQELAASVGIDVKSQRNIELKSQSAKKLPGVAATPKHAKSLIGRLQDSFLVNNKAVKETLEAYSKRKQKDSAKAGDKDKE